VRTAVDELKTALAGDDVAEVRAKHEALSTASQKLGSALYEAQQADSADAGTPGDAEGGPSFTKDSDGAAAGSSAGGDEDVVDAEIVDDESERDGAK
jgi:molecular chaperone DnaK